MTVRVVMTNNVAVITVIVTVGVTVTETVTLTVAEADKMTV